MSNYKETSAEGTTYTRARTVVLNNNLNYKGIEFVEEKVTSLENGEVIQRGAGSVNEVFNADTIDTEFPLLNPETGEPVGSSIKYGEVYAIMFSLYMSLAVKRDVRVAAEEAERAAWEAERAAREAERAAAEAAAAEGVTNTDVSGE